MSIAGSEAGDLADLPEQDRLMEAAKKAQAATGLQQAAQSLQSKAALITNPKERERLLREAHAKQVEAHGNTRTARMLRSGAFQGAAGGGGIGAGVSMGLGTVVGTVVGGVTAIPTMAVGGLVGAGVGAIHGPFVRMGGGEEKKKKNKSGGGEEGKEELCGTSFPPNDSVGNGSVRTGSTAGTKLAQTSGGESRPGPAGSQSGRAKKKPRKLEVRSHKPAERAEEQKKAD